MISWTNCQDTLLNCRLTKKHKFLDECEFNIISCNKTLMLFRRKLPNVLWTYLVNILNPFLSMGTHVVLLPTLLAEKVSFNFVYGDSFWQLETSESKQRNNIYLRSARLCWQLIVAPWRLLFAFVPPYHIAHGWVAFICSLMFISGIAYVLTKFTDLISCVSGSSYCPI